MAILLYMAYTLKVNYINKCDNVTFTLIEDKNMNNLSLVEHCENVAKLKHTGTALLEPKFDGMIHMFNQDKFRPPNSIHYLLVWFHLILVKCSQFFILYKDKNFYVIHTNNIINKFGGDDEFYTVEKAFYGGELVYAVDSRTPPNISMFQNNPDLSAILSYIDATDLII